MSFVSHSRLLAVGSPLVARGFAPPQGQPAMENKVESKDAMAVTQPEGTLPE